MSHYQKHLRDAFLDWLGNGCPDVTTIEDNYEPHAIMADDLLRRFVLPDGCTDIMPRWACEQIAGLTGTDRDVRGMTYAIAAGALLVQRAVGDAGARLFLNKVLAGRGPA